eukprot:180346_1
MSNVTAIIRINATTFNNITNTIFISTSISNESKSLPSDAWRIIALTSCVMIFLCLIIIIPCWYFKLKRSVYAEFTSEPHSECINLGINEEDDGLLSCCFMYQTNFGNQYRCSIHSKYIIICTQVIIVILSFMSSLLISNHLIAPLDIIQFDRGYYIVLLSCIQFPFCLMKTCSKYNLARINAYKNSRRGFMTRQTNADFAVNFDISWTNQKKATVVDLVDATFDIIAGIALMKNVEYNDDFFNLYLIIGTYLGVGAEMMEVILDIIFALPDLCYGENMKYVFCLYMVEIIASIVEIGIGVYVGSTVNSDETFMIIILFVLSVVILVVCSVCCRQLLWICIHMECRPITCIPLRKICCVHIPFL